MDKGECGCLIAYIGSGQSEIEYCPLHKAAPELYEALKGVLPLLTGAFYKTNQTKAEIVAVRQAIAKVEN